MFARQQCCNKKMRKKRAPKKDKCGQAVNTGLDEKIGVFGLQKVGVSPGFHGYLFLGLCPGAETGRLYASPSDLSRQVVEQQNDKSRRAFLKGQNILRAFCVFAFLKNKRMEWNCWWCSPFFFRLFFFGGGQNLQKKVRAFRTNFH